jgi:hypothetical protein
MSGDGKYVLICNGGNLSISDNYGNNDTWVTTNTAANTRRPDVSTTGQYMSVPLSNNQIFVSVNFGDLFVLKGPTSLWESCAISSSGLIQIAVGELNAYVTPDAWDTFVITSLFNDAWKDCAIASTGQYMTVIKDRVNIQVSNNFGASWSSVSTGGVRQYDSVSMSSSGQIQVVTDDTFGFIFISKDFGVTWTARDTNRNWKGCALSSDGIKQASLVDGGDIYQSTNTGDSWNRKQIVYSNPFNSIDITGVAVSDNGQYVMYAAYGNFIYTSSNFGKSFMRKHVINTYSDVAMSANGLIQIAVRHGGLVGGNNDTAGIDISNNFGITWTDIDLGANLLIRRCAISSDGEIITIVGFNMGILTSDINVNGGAFANDDNTQGNFAASFGVNIWSDITMSSDGSIKYASTEANGIWKYVDAGNVGWVNTLPNENASMISCRDSVDGNGDGLLVTYATMSGLLKFSNDGLATAAATVGPTGINQRGGTRTLGQIKIGPGGLQVLAAWNGKIYITNNNWADYSAVSSVRNSTRAWSSVDMSLDGTQLIASVFPGYIYQSFDSGSTWGANQIERRPSTISMSNNGTIQLVGSSGNELYVSGDTGNTWTTAGISNNWRQVAVARDDGTVQVAIPYRGLIYTSANSGVTWVQRDAIRNWRGISMNTAGTTLFAVDYGGHIYKSNNDITTWIVTSDQGANPPNTQNWISVSVSGNGAFVIAAIENGTIYKSVNGGGAWTITQDVNNASIGPLNWQSIAISNNGAIYAGVVYGGKIYVAFNQLNWLAKDSDRDWMDIAVSTDGAVQTAVVYNGQIYVSTNTGYSWVARGDVKPWVSVDINSNGTIQTAVVENGEIYKSIDSGVSWFIQPEMKEITSIEMSSDGTVQTVAEARGSIYFSTNSGSTWLQSSESRNWRSVAMTLNGVTHTAAEYGGTIYRATNNNGVLTGWVPIPGTGKNTARNYTSIAMNATGLIRVAVVEGGSIYKSIDSGAAWAEIADTGNFNWQGVAISEPLTAGDNGTFTIYAVARGKNIFRSINSGVGWAEVSTGLALNWRDMAVSNDGTIVTAIVQGGQIYTYSIVNNVITWTARDSNRNWVKVDMSDDGTKQIAIVDGGQVYSSIDSGVTWVASESFRSWRGISINGAGTLQMASTKSRVLSHPFALNQRLTLTVESINSGVIDSFTASEITNGTNNGVANTQTLLLHDYNLADARNFTSIRKEATTTTDIFIPSANYTPASLVTTVNAKLAENNAAFAAAFTYDTSTGKISFTPPFSGAGLISSTNLLQRMGFTELTSSTILTAGTAIASNSIINTDISGPLNIFIKSDIIGELRKNKTAFSTNSKLKNLIAPLDLDEVSNSYKIPFPVEMFLSRKSDISSIDIQISDEEGNIVNLNNSAVQVNFYFYSS